MTRFARAKGSKSSNEKTPENSTPWEVMKEQLNKAKQESDEAKKRHEAEQQRIENYEKFLKEQKVQKRKAEWCEFPNSHLGKKEKQTESKIKHKNKKTNNINPEIDNSSEKYTSSFKKKVSKKSLEHQLSLESNCTEQTSEGLEVPKKKNKKQKRDKLNTTNDSSTSNTNNNHENKNSNTNHSKQNDTPTTTVGPNNQSNKKLKNKKIKDGTPQRRKPEIDKSFQLIINGKEIELVRYDGFPVMKRDAERLEQLKNEMIKKGIPKSEVQRTMKLERRRAEKALARMKKDVCYNCRKGGHNLSDCPELKAKIPGADGVCFKCGSTEHRQFECKVQRDKEFRFATCFICKEPGHIARQCPDNPKGLYPNGGSCKLCGDVTHLRKDCPTVQDKKEDTSFKLQTMDGAENIEDIGQQLKSNITTGASKKPKKIKF